MAHIEIDTDDLSLLANDINEMNVKIDNLKSTINTKYDKVKNMNFYTEGFNNISKYLESQVSKINGIKSKLKKYQDEIVSIEKTYSEKFNDVVVPNLQSSSASLVVMSPSITGNPGSTATGKDTQPETTSQTQTVSQTTSVETSPTVITNTQNGANFVESTTPNDVTNKEKNKNTSNSNSSGNQTKADPTVDNEESKTGLNVFGVLAGAAGIVGAGGLAAHAVMKSKDEEEDKEDKEESEVKEL